MTPSYTRVHFNARAAIRTALASVVKANTGVLTSVVILSDGTLTRGSGSFLDDGFGAGDEILLSGFQFPNNNGLAYIQGASDTGLTLLPPVGTGRDFATEDATGRNIQITAGWPTGQLDENSPTFKPVQGQPWCRESYKAGPSLRRSIGPKALVRTNGLYMLNLFYPTGVGMGGVDGLSDAVSAVLYPGADLWYGGLRFTILSCSRSGGLIEPEWVSVPLNITFFNHSTAPQ